MSVALRTCFKIENSSNSEEDHRDMVKSRMDLSIASANVGKIRIAGPSALH